MTTLAYLPPVDSVYRHITFMVRGWNGISVERMCNRLAITAGCLTDTHRTRQGADGFALSIETTEDFTMDCSLFVCGGQDDRHLLKNPDPKFRPYGRWWWEFRSPKQDTDDDIHCCQLTIAMPRSFELPPVDQLQTMVQRDCLQKEWNGELSNRWEFECNRLESVLFKDAEDNLYLVSTAVYIDADTLRPFESYSDYVEYGTHRDEYIHRLKDDIVRVGFSHLFSLETQLGSLVDRAISVAKYSGLRGDWKDEKSDLYAVTHGIICELIRSAKSMADTTKSALIALLPNLFNTISNNISDSSSE